MSQQLRPFSSFTDIHSVVSEHVDNIGSCVLTFMTCTIVVIMGAVAVAVLAAYRILWPMLRSKTRQAISKQSKPRKSPEVNTSPIAGAGTGAAVDDDDSDGADEAADCGRFHWSSAVLHKLRDSYVGRSWAHIIKYTRPAHEALPPGSMGWPLLGETMEFLEPHSATSKGKFMEEHSSRYGNVFKSCLFGHPTIVSADPDLNKLILLNENKLFQCSYPSTVSGILGKWSMLVVVGESHKLMRSIALNFMSPQKLKAHFMDDINTHVLHTLISWEENRVILAQQEAKKFTFNLMAKQIISFNPGELRTVELMRDYYTFMKGVIAVPLNIPGTAYYRAMQSRAKILEILKNTLNVRANQNLALGDGDGHRCNDLLEIVTISGLLSTEQVLDLVLNMLFAGHETSSVALTLAMKFLAGAPDALRELRDEHTRIQASKKHDTVLLWDDYKKMGFTQCVINETLRLGNVVRFVHRKALQDVRYKDYVIPKGWKVLPVFSAVHLDDSVFKNPLKFDPWRWQEDPTENAAYFIPFGGGSRLCAGADLAKLELAVFLHYLVLTYDWKLAEPDVALAFPFIEFKNGLPITVTKLEATMAPRWADAAAATAGKSAWSWDFQSARHHKASAAIARTEPHGEERRP